AERNEELIETRSRKKQEAKRNKKLKKIKSERNKEPIETRSRKKRE
ncbi:25235_t:CDS:1, partial [Racocetra persica]